MTPEELAREKEAIAELITRYNYAIDHNDFQGWADCFAPEGVFDGMIGKYAAHSELERFVADVKKLTATTPNLRHYVTNIQAEINGDQARSRCFLLMTSMHFISCGRTQMCGGIFSMIGSSHENKPKQGYKAARRLS